MSKLNAILSDEHVKTEIVGRIKRGMLDPRFPLANPAAAIAAIESSHAGESAVFDSGTEAIILMLGRPAFFVKGGRCVVGGEEVWSPKLTSANALLSPAIAAVGRIEVKNHPGFEWLGTGWFVAPKVVVTNRHVANEFAIKGADGVITFRKNYENRLIGARIDLREEYLQADELEFQVLRVLHIEEPEGPDLALLEVESRAGAPAPLRLQLNAQAGAEVVVVGYPAWDGRRNEPPVMRQIFGDIYDVKRVQPGRVVTVTQTIITHDCTTLGGNSGSPVVDLSTGDVVGLHFAGTYKTSNSAVPAQLLKDRLSILGV
jgi:endonuclease G, mitochondrial